MSFWMVSLDRTRGIEHRRSHQRPVLGKGAGHRGGKLESGKVVAICDQLVPFSTGEPEHEVGREAFGVAFDLLVQAFRRYVVECGQVGVNHDFVATDHEGALCNSCRGDQSIRCAFPTDDELRP